ncbi:hypothetical protein [Pseudobutyrivibrio xylanivorans]|uniref:Ig-like domain-containing protein n=1 Tax=Pseudobutyrivibrio xylanivorans TaxID=185007 RepID=A0A1G5S012_PSEXY|nr:hypothetical protein [Pseudobutyrivibrio xylanivorans]SCZ79735.1 hypothetical protein SAMN02910350_01924 [Pseudobutyrivibrio xylanivorans]
MVKKRVFSIIALVMTVFMLGCNAESTTMASMENIADEEVALSGPSEKDGEFTDEIEDEGETEENKDFEVPEDAKSNDTEIEGESEGAEESEGTEGTSGEQSDKEWGVSLNDSYEHLTLSVSKNSAKAGDIVTIIAAVDVGYQLTSITVKPVDNEEISNITPGSAGNNSYEYTQPACNVKIYATAEKAGYTVVGPSVPLGNGTVSVVEIIRESEDSKASGTSIASYGDKVVLDVVPANTYSLSSIDVTFSDGQVCNGLKNFDGRYEFIMAAADVTSIVATFSNYVALSDLTRPVIINGDGNTIPQVGDRLNAVSAALPVTWEWYADGVLIDNSQSETPDIYVLTMNEVGKSIMVVAKQSQTLVEGQPAVEVEAISDPTQPVIIGEGTIISAEEAASAVSYDYYNEIAVIAPAYEAAADDNSISGVDQLAITDILDSETDRVIYVRRKADMGVRASLWTAVALPERPDAPDLTAESPSSALAADGKIMGTLTTMEYRLAEETTYQSAADSVTNVKAGKYYVRIAATDSSFAGKITEVDVLIGFVELTSERKPVIGNTTAARTQPYVGDVLKVTTTAGPGITYQWYANGTVITGAVEDTIILTPSLYNKKVAVKATQAVNADGKGHPTTEKSIMSASVGPVKKEPVPDLSSNDYGSYLKIDYSAEKATANSSYEVSSSKGRTGSETLKLSSIVDRNTNRCFYVRQKETDYKEASNWAKIDLSERPAAPANLTTEKASDTEKADGKIVGTTSAMEYRLTSESTYKKASDGSTMVKSGSYHVRYAVSGSTFASKTTTVRVTAGAEKKTEDEEVDEVKKTTRSKKASAAKKAGRVSNTNNIELPANIVDETGLWSMMSDDTQTKLNNVMKVSGGEIVDANALLFGNPEELEAKPVSDAPVALALGNGAIVIEMDNPDSNAMLSNAFAVASAVLSTEQLEFVEHGGFFEIMISSAVVTDNEISESEMAVIDDCINSYYEEYPNLLKVSFLDINLMYQIDNQGWTVVGETYEPIEFILTLPEDYWGSIDEFFILREHEGEATLLDDEDEDLNTVTISTGQFSTYVLIHNSSVPLTNLDSYGADTAKAGNKVVGKIWMILFWIIVGLDIGLAGFYIFRKKDLLAKIKMRISRRS